MLLIAEADPAGTAVLVVLGTLVGSAATWLAKMWWDRRGQNRAWKKEDEKTIVDHLTTLVNRMEHQIEVLERGMITLREKYTQAVSHVRYLEGIMESKGMDFKKMAPDILSGSSELHVPTDEEDIT